MGSAIGLVLSIFLAEAAGGIGRHRNKEGHSELVCPDPETHLEPAKLGVPTGLDHPVSADGECRMDRLADGGV